MSSLRLFALLPLAGILASAGSLASDLPVDRSPPVICAVGSFGPLPSDIRPSDQRAIIVHVHGVHGDPRPASQMEARLASACMANNHAVRGNRFTFGFPSPGPSNVYRRHVTIIACSPRLHRPAAFDGVISPSHDFTAQLRPIASNGSLARQCS